MKKPFSFDELLANIPAFLRGGTTERAVVLTVNLLELDSVARKVCAEGNLIDRTAR